ncbi:MAG: hypothetical protein G3M70_09285 [Candidatus Nitronauta litoralis]|uniref:Uncharacterized protein n=1 Tax=Candidatus Nitronauta litoralis TaxID=2705533 RepID=A0A7T0BWC7_9BACT|nr:MAG: hypothetical protein G3M70_09285 [Candidatus Nitronauta litoralis]
MQIFKEVTLLTLPFDKLSNKNGLQAPGDALNQCNACLSEALRQAHEKTPNLALDFDFEVM